MTTRSFFAVAVALVLSLACAACPRASDGDSGDLLDSVHLDGASAQAEIARILHALFPALSDDEIGDLKGSLSLKDIEALREELEAIRKEAAKLSAELFKSAQDRVAERDKALKDHNDGFPEGLEAVGRACSYDTAAGHAQVHVSGVFDGHDSVTLDESAISLQVNGKTQPFTLSCLPNGSSVDLVFLIDITGSMSNVIASVRNSVVDFIDLIEASGLHGTVSVVTFQDSVGVNTTFQEPAPANDYERSPFFEPVDLADRDAVDALRDFVKTLEANRGEDAPENLAGAIDFARNDVIGTMSNGEPNVIGDGREDPAGTQRFPKLTSDQQVFVVLTDVGFHGDHQDETNSSLLAPFVPRDAGQILATLQRTGTTVHVSDPSWADASTKPSESYVDADYWASHTGGLGEDVALGYSLVDLELVVVAEKTGLLDITLDKILESSCTLDFDAQLSADAKVTLALQSGEHTFTTALHVDRY